jgi:hypothetical protein
MESGRTPSRFPARGQESEEWSYEKLLAASYYEELLLKIVGTTSRLLNFFIAGVEGWDAALERVFAGISEDAKSS